MLHELEDGRDYYVFVTTADGLYRYDMNDIVRVTGRVHQTPSLVFIQKGKGVTSITGEKLYETQVLDAAMGVFSDRNLQAEFFIMLADQENAAYTLFLEALNSESEMPSRLSGDLDKRLQASNIDYESKRVSGRLAPLTVRLLRPGTGDMYRRSRVAQGQRDAQFKYLHLQYSSECGFDFDAFAEPV